MTDYNFGDLVSIKHADNDIVLGTLYPEDFSDLTSERLWIPIEHPDMRFTFETMLADPELEIRLEKAILDRIPAEPGKYREADADANLEALRELLGDVWDDVKDQFEEIAESHWTFNEDGTFTDASGETRGTEWAWVFADTELVKVD